MALKFLEPKPSSKLISLFLSISYTDLLKQKKLIKNVLLLNLLNHLTWSKFKHKIDILFKCVIADIDYNLSLSMSFIMFMNDKEFRA